MKSKNYLLTFLFLLSVTVSHAQLDDPNFFPRAAWLQSTFRAQAYKDAGMNMYIGLWNPLNETQLTELTDAGMYVITKQTDFGLENINDTTILAWKQDKSEPDNAQWNSETGSYDPCIEPSFLINRYNEIKENDPSRSVFVGLGRGVSDIDWIGRGTCTGNYEMYREETNGYIAAGDIVSFDIYPVNDTSPLTSENLWYVPKGMDSLVAWSSTPKLHFAWIEATKFDASSNRGPTPEEVKSEVWMAIIHGARGIGYFCHRLSPDFDEAALLHDDVMIENVAAINQTIDDLAAIINSPNTMNATVVSSSNTDIPVDVMTKSYDDNDYIFAVAMRPGSTMASFTVPTGSVIEVVGEDRTLNESGGQFTDAFADYGVHIYKIILVTDIATRISAKNDYILFPNPSAGKINIHSSQQKETFTITVYNNIGAIVFHSNNDKTIDLSNQAAGVYFVSIRDEDEIFTKKIILVGKE